MKTMSGAIRSVRILCALVVLAAMTSPAVAQDITGALQGSVVSPEGKPEPEVRVRVSGPNLQGSRETTTDRTGFFQFLALPPGRYTVNLTRVGLRLLEMRETVVELGRTTAVGPITLEPQPIEMAPVVVSRAPLKLDPVHTAAGGNLSARDYDALPVDRDYKSLIAILPQVNQSYRGDPVNVGGSTGLENQYYIDGVNVTDARWANRATSLPHNFVRAVDVKSAGYEAQYGRALGGLVNAVTYSGTNEFESEVFGFVQPEALSMTPAAAPVIPAEGAVSYDYGARASGPLVRDRLWFSAAANPRVDQVDKEVPGLGFYPDRTNAVRFASKLTWRASPATNVELSVFGDPTVQDAVALFGLLPGVTAFTNPDPLLTRMETGGTVASLRATMAPSQSFLLQTSVARQWDRYSQRGQAGTTTSEVYTDYVEGTVGGGYPGALTDSKGRTTLSTRGTLMLARHTVVAGVEYEDVNNTSSSDFRVIQRFGASLWFRSHEAYSGTVRNRSPAAYLQDSWRVTDRLAVNAGLRWSGQYLVGASGRTAQKITDEWQPRGGFSWQLGRVGTQRVFGSFGRFYQTLPINLALLWFVDWQGTYSYYSTDPRLPGSVPDQVIDGSTFEADYAHQIPGLQAEHFDEFTLGYERMLGADNRLTVRSMRRDLRSSFQFGMDLSRDPIWVLGTPGKGDFSFLPPPKREYTALELATEGTWQRMRYRASYVLSRTWGNDPGLYNSDFNFANPGQITTFWMPHQGANSTGYLPNDRTHVFKLSTAYETGFGLMAGTIITFESGGPINDFAASVAGPTSPSFLVQRGTAGRSPALWNLDLRLTYALPLARGPRARLQADVLHIGNPRRAVQVDEMHYPTLDANGNPDTSNPNPNYKHPVAYQPPMAARIGLVVSF